MNKIKIVWLCFFSDAKLRSRLKINKYYWGNIVRRCFSMNSTSDFAIWNSNAIAEVEKIDSDFEFHIVVPHCGINGLQEFEENGLFYHVYWSELDVIIEKIRRKFNMNSLFSYPRHRKIVSSILSQVKPSIVHIIGIENKALSMCALDFHKDFICISQLQTLINDFRFKEKCNRTPAQYEFDALVEREIIKRSDFIGTPNRSYISIIRDRIDPKAHFLPIRLALTENASSYGNLTKKYDFVYFARDIEKAFDWALEAFAIVHSKHSELTLDVVGGYTSDYKKKIDRRIDELGLKKYIFFEGMLPSHEDVLRQIKLSRFALLPLKIDLVSGSIREAMASGLPVVTTVTPETPLLNKDGQAVLLSSPGDHMEMATNMQRLIDDKELRDTLINNALRVSNDLPSNATIIKEWIDAYHSCLKP